MFSARKNISGLNDSIKHIEVVTLIKKRKFCLTGLLETKVKASTQLMMEDYL